MSTKTDKQETPWVKFEFARDVEYRGEPVKKGDVRAMPEVKAKKREKDGLGKVVGGHVTITKGDGGS
jgi:hypothetical protein